MVGPPKGAAYLAFSCWVVVGVERWDSAAIPMGVEQAWNQFLTCLNLSASQVVTQWTCIFCLVSRSLYIEETHFPN